MENRIVINNAIRILPDHVLKHGFVVCEAGRILQTGEGVFQPEASDIVIDAKGKYLSPGFIDMHTHGAGGHDFMDCTTEAWLGAAETHACYGTTSLVPTTLTSTLEELLYTFELYNKAKEKNTMGASFLGLHLEGPYFAYNQRGAQDPAYLRNPEPEEYEAILAASDNIMRWSMAPELSGALELGRLLRSVNVLPAIGHSDATYEEVVEAFKVGFTHITHLYSCMSSITRRNAFRHAGVLEAAYLIDDMSVEIIADGIHIPKSLLQYVCKFKSHDQIVLCTDSMRAAGMPDGEYMLGSLENGQPVIVEDGVTKLPDRSAFAGSVATADRLVRTMIDRADLSISEAVGMITRNPARILGLCSKGVLAPGMDADLVIFDDRISVNTTIVNGKIVYSQN